MRHWQQLAALLLAAACSGDATAPDPATVEPEPPGPPANRAPVATADSIPAVRLPGPGEAVAVAVGAYFTDPDGDALTFAAASTDTAVVSAAVAGDTVRLTGGGTGGAGTVTVTASDAAGLSARATVAVAVNRAPVAVGEIPARRRHDTLILDGRVVAEVAGVTWRATIMRSPSPSPAVTTVSDYFTDPDGDTLTFAASSSDTAVVQVAVRSARTACGLRCVEDPSLLTAFGTKLDFYGRAVGEASVTVTAADPDSLETRAVFTVEVTESPERATLEVFYEATGGPNWTRNDNWLTAAPMSMWYGLRGSTGGVSRIELDNNNLVGSIPSEIAQLLNLRFLSLSGNELSGPIPHGLGELLDLLRVNLSNNELSGAIPPDLGGIPRLMELDLTGNNLSGPIPLELFRLGHRYGLRLDPDRGFCVHDKPGTLDFLLSHGLLYGTWLSCVPSDSIYVGRALMVDGGDGISVSMDPDFEAGRMTIMDPTIVDATSVRGGGGVLPGGRREGIRLDPVGVGRTRVVIESADSSLPRVVEVVVRESVSTFFIDMLMKLPAPLPFERSLTEAADWWSEVLDGTYWHGEVHGHMTDEVGSISVSASSDHTNRGGAVVGTAFVSAELINLDPPRWKSGGGSMWIATGWTLGPEIISHEMGHILGLVGWDALVEGGYFMGENAVRQYRDGGGDRALSGVPVGNGAHWRLGGELMSAWGGPGNSISLAALADVGYTRWT